MRAEQTRAASLDELPALLTIREAAELLRLSVGTVERFCRAGQLACARLGIGPRPRVRVLRESVWELLGYQPGNQRRKPAPAGGEFERVVIELGLGKRG